MAPQPSTLQPVPETWQTITNPHPRIQSLHSRIARKRDQWLTLQIEKSHAMQEYLHKRRFFEESTGVIMESFQNGNGFSNPVSESQACQLRADSEALRIQSDTLQELERRSAVIQYAIARLEAKLMDNIGALAGLMPGRTLYIADGSQSEDSDS
ncbi:hypothetical protein CBER1_11426 [Cercospora berteroae]|uniref:Uncharacterized protein n=1 Tax=Cercospora berteroae TaxID=357750 RepID=A0A2S6BZY9_9PEZI|nr:hypothetical protein CBER1_11426 [Cercospora berteroae]